ncbi:uncharacterized protein RCC_09013 [Ramularia collo-cygni]|uniref:Ubiquitin 3 binding protein But2 C-terminal domain-containing protein n=1 Tax=Ramularia collo-cygni TaxID=112498 RepID=A0A2D3VDZ5_9PEZI|nr:uncharacterized protein RCC_09013 [Ramularia collo-cygni]CZT23302.1 uncharacterized protein RCC_09013 [Ramularia collo-cygni]
MLFKSFFTVAAAAVSLASAETCTTQKRIEGSRQVAVAYNAVGLGASAEEFQLVPWGSPDSAGSCLVTIIPNGLGCGIPVATTGAGTTQFAIETRQVFNKLEITEIIPFSNGTVLLSVDIRLGLREILPLPATFHAWVYMDFNVDCRIYSARAYADVPTSILTFITAQQINIPNGGLYPICSNLPVGGQKRAINFEA